MENRIEPLASATDPAGRGRRRNRRGRAVLAGILAVCLMASGCGDDPPKDPANAPLPGQEGS